MYCSNSSAPALSVLPASPLQKCRCKPWQRAASSSSKSHTISITLHSCLDPVVPQSTLPGQKRTNNDLVNVLAGKYGEAPLVKVHQRQVLAAPLRDVLIRVQTHQKEVALLLRQLEASHTRLRTPEAQMPTGLHMHARS